MQCGLYRRGYAVSPGFTPRPSLSDLVRTAAAELAAGVAGVHAPAFVERCHGPCSANVTPAVSPGFTPRPSLSEDGQVDLRAFLEGCRRGSRPGLR